MNKLETWKQILYVKEYVSNNIFIHSRNIKNYFRYLNHLLDIKPIYSDMCFCMFNANYIIQFTLFFFCVELAFPFIATNRPFVRLKLESYTFFVPLMKFYVFWIKALKGFMRFIISCYWIRRPKTVAICREKAVVW